MTETQLHVFRIFRSIQGESSFSGLPCGFIRLSGCPLDCTYCDSRRAAESSGRTMSISEILSAVTALERHLIEVTGGEPLHQAGTPALLTSLCETGATVLLETSGAFPIHGLDPRVRLIMDIKCPGSGMDSRFLPENLDALVPDRDQVKFVISSFHDFQWCLSLIRETQLLDRAPVLFSPVSGRVKADSLAGWILDSRLPVRLQVQLHKVLWPTDPER